MIIARGRSAVCAPSTLQIKIPPGAGDAGRLFASRQKSCYSPFSLLHIVLLLSADGSVGNYPVSGYSRDADETTFGGKTSTRITLTFTSFV